MKKPFYPKTSLLWGLTLLLTWLLGLVPHTGQAQLYYPVSDASGATTLDQLRRVPLAGGAEQTVLGSNTANFPAAPGAAVLDAANNRLLVANAFNNSGYIAAVNLSTNAVTTFATLAAISGSASTTLSGAGLVVANGFVYYDVSDGSGGTTLDQLRRVPLAGGAEQIVLGSNTANFPAAPGAMVLDAANNRLLVANAFNNSGYIVAVDLSTNAVTTFATLASISGSASTTLSGAGLVVANGFVYYDVSDASGGTTLDQLRRVPLAGGAEQIVLGSNTANFPAAPGSAVLDAANNRLLVANAFNNSGYIVAVDLSTNAVTTFATLASISGSASTTLSGAGLVVLPAPTTVASIVPAGSSPTNASSVTYTVTFAASVTGLTLSNFSLTATGSVTGAFVTSLSGTGTTYTVTVNTGSGDGTLRLNLGNATGINPGISNSPYTSGTAYTIAKTAPTVVITSSTAANGTTSGTSPFAYTVTFSEAVTGFVAGDVTVGNGAISGFTAVSGTTYTFNVTPTVNGAVTVNVPANVAQDQAGNGNTAAAQYSITYAQPVTAAPVMVTPANGSFVNTTTPTYTGTAVAASTVTVFVDGTALGTTTATAGGNWNLSQPTALAQGSHTVRATAQSSGSAVSANSNTNTFTVDTVAPTVAISSTAGASGSTTSTTPIPFTVTFSKGVAGFNAGSIVVSNGTVSGFAGAGTTYTFSVTPTIPGTVTVNVAANVAQDAAGNGNTAASQFAITYNLLVTAAPVVSAPANGSLLNTATPTYSGTAPAGSNVAVQVDGAVVGNTTALGGTWSVVQSPGLPDGPHSVRATAQLTGQSVSLFSNSNAFTLDTTPPTVSISSSAGASGSTTGTSPIPFTVTFSKNVTGFVAGDVVVSNGTVSGFAGAGTTYTFSVTPTTAGTVTTVNVAANVVQDAAGNGNTASGTYSITYAQPAMASAQNVMVQLNANGTATLNAPSVNNGSTGTGTLTYSIQKIVYGQVGEGQTLTLSTPTGENFSAIRYASYGTSTGSNGNYTLGGCNASNSIAVVGSALIGNPSGSIGANNGTFGDPCGGTVKNLAVVAAYSANAASLSYACANVAGPNYVLLTVTDGNSNTSTMTAQVTVVAPPTATITSISPNSGLVGTTVTISGTNLSGATVISVNGTAASIASASASALTFQVPAGATSGNVVVSLPCSQSLSQPFTVITPAPVVTAPANGSLLNTATPTYAGTAVANATVTVYVDGTALGTTTATAGGNWSLSQPTALAQGSHTVRATAQSSGSAVSANSNTNTFTIDTVAPTVAISSTAGASGSTTSTTPIPFTVTFSKSVTGFNAGSIVVSNGTVSGFAGSGTTYTFSVTPTTAGTVTTVNVAANVAQDAAGNGNTAASQFAITYQPSTLSWTGLVSPDWFTAGNWSAGVPTAVVDVIIPAAAPNMPLIAAGTATTKSLTLNAGSTLAQTGGTLDVHANLTNNGSLSATGGTVVLGSTTLASVLGSSNTRFWNLTTGPSGAQSGTSALTSVQRLLTLNGNFSTQGNPLTLESNASATALVVNNASNAIIGNVTVQRYIAQDLNAGLGYRHFSAPISTASVASLATGSFTPLVNGAYNTSATPTAVTPFPTVYGYDQARLATATNNLAAFDKGWFSPNSLGDALTVGQGYTVNLAANQTLSVTGSQNNGNVALNLNRNSGGTAIDAGWQLVGNPYPSPLDYSLVAPADRLNLDAAIYVFESTSQYVGTYRANVNGVGGNANSPNAVLALGQGFFVRVSNGQSSGTLTLRNNQRPTAYINPVYHRTAETRPLVQLDLHSATGTDPVYVYFENGATAGVDREFDAVKLPNSNGLNVSAEAGVQRLAINALPTLGTATVTVPLTVGVPAAGSFSFNAAQLLNLGTTPVYLRDRQTGAVVDLARQPSYSFVVSNVSALVTGRFELVFAPQAVLATAPAALAAQVGVYPNPATTTAFVELPAALGRVVVAAELVDALGRTVRTQSLPAQGAAAHRLDLANLATGLYTLHLNTSAGVVVKKLVVQ